MTTVDLPTLQSIRRLLRASVRHAEIARRFDLAVGTISRIASVRRLRRAKLHLLTENELPEDDPPPDYLAANLRRCPGCGGLVYQWPCLACRLRAAEEAGVALEDDEPLSHQPGVGEREFRVQGSGFRQMPFDAGYSVLSTQYSHVTFRPLTSDLRPLKPET